MKNVDDVLSRFQERNKDVPATQLYNATVAFKVLASSAEMAAETVRIVGEHLNRFNDISGAKGELDD